MDKGLGKGLEAIFGEELVRENETVEWIHVEMIEANPYQPRQQFDDEQLQELAQSIEQSGVIQPIIVRKKGKKYELVAGERRLRATQLAGKETIPTIIREITDEQSMEYALLENLQRTNLNPIEEAQAYEKLSTALQLKQNDLAKRVGKSRPYIANMLRLLKLPQSVQKMLIEGQLSNGHGRALLGLKDESQIEPLAERAIQYFWNVRQVEQQVQQLNDNVSHETKKETPRNVFIESEEQQLEQYFGTKVQIKQTKNKGKIEIEFMTDDDLERILQLMKREQ
ncbi:ParB/RepB/Spo0J family partition protein [Savagea sp. SN6]|uniref:ParB/RepB/Spo0J family partition protein n=1 Tax=Savagea serpentis TaxID=2785297 RepID=A0A8J7G656_9BACL|nr:ParB/RepB/Spo0J family partition protein [Savagea serpentis]MBF4502127.1 ParB/RepB/Spo0J family partition protein [Savagea serpentis]